MDSQGGYVQFHFLATMNPSAFVRSASTMFSMCGLCLGPFPSVKCPKSSITLCARVVQGPSFFYDPLPLTLILIDGVQLSVA